MNVAAAMRDRDVERGLDLPQVGVERPAEVRERAVVERGEREVVWRGWLAIGPSADSPEFRAR